MRTCSKTECNHNVMMSSRNAPRVLPIPPRGELCAIRFRFWPAGTTHLSTGRPHGIRPSPRRPRKEDPGRLIHIAVQNVSAAIRTCHTGSLFLERMSPSRQEDLRIRGGRRVVRCAFFRLLRLFPSAALPSPSAAPLLLVQWRVKGRSRGKGAQQTRTRTGTRVSPCTGPPPHPPLPPLPPHWLRPSHRGRGRTGERRGPRLGKAADAHLPASAPRPSSSHSSTNPGEKGSTNGIHVRESRS